jgi:2-phospho-L-lactate transferase/gluconeogenesis factor (CofD/UPF0052 family)
MMVACSAPSRKSSLPTGPSTPDIHLLDHLPTADERRTLDQGGEAELNRFIAAHGVIPVANPRLLARLAEADLIVYAPGTQHSSLFPSYLTPGVGAAIARNLKAVKS